MPPLPYAHERYTHRDSLLHCFMLNTAAATRVTAFLRATSELHGSSHNLKRDVEC